MIRLVCVALFLSAACAVACSATPPAGCDCCKPSCTCKPGKLDAGCVCYPCQCKPPVVTIEPAAPAKQLTYAEVYARVSAGERLTLAVGPYQYRPGIDGSVSHLPGIPPGVYECYRENGVNKMRPYSPCPGGVCPVRPARAGEPVFSALPVGVPVVSTDAS